MTQAKNPFPIITKYSRLYFAISAVLLLVSMFSLWKFGVRLGVDFTGGASYSFSLPPTAKEGDTVAKIKEKLSPIIPVQSVQDLGEQNYEVTLSQPAEKKTEVETALKESFGGVASLSYTQVGAQIGQELLKKTMIAVGIALLVVGVYVSIRFASLRFGVAALLAVIHDLTIVLGSLAIAGKLVGMQIDGLIIPALLTIIAFSLHDTVVVFGHLREHKRTSAHLSFAGQVDAAVIATGVRSLRNSLALVFVLLALFLFGPVTLRPFIFALLVGAAIGTYSSTFTAVPLILTLEKVKITLPFKRNMRRRTEND